MGWQGWRWWWWSLVNPTVLWNCRGKQNVSWCSVHLAWGIPLKEPIIVKGVFVKAHKSSFKPRFQAISAGPFLIDWSSFGFSRFPTHILATYTLIDSCLVRQDHAQNSKQQLWMDGRGWVLYLTVVWIAAIWNKKSRFFLGVSQHFCNWL